MSKKYELQEGLNELHEKLEEVIDVAEELNNISKEFRCFGGQLDQYFIGWMKTFLRDAHQPGSIASLQRMLNDDEDGYDIEEES